MSKPTSLLNTLPIRVLYLLSTCIVLPLCASAQITTPPNPAVPPTPAVEFTQETKKPAPKSDGARDEVWKTFVENSEALMPEVILQDARIVEEVNSLPTRTDLPATHWARKWAGTYNFPVSMVSYRFSIAPQNGITHTTGSCLGPPSANSGSITGSFDEDTDNQIDGIIATWKYPRVDDSTLEKFYFVAWDGAEGGTGRQLLIPESDMLNFVNRYNQGGFRRWSCAGFVQKLTPEEEDKRPFYVPSKPSIAPPPLPARWAKLLIASPLHAKVLSVTADQRVNLDKGSANGVYLGMEIDLSDDSATREIVIDQLTEHAASGQYRAYLQQPLPAVGTILQVAAGADVVPNPAISPK